MNNTATINESDLSALLLKDTGLRLIEPYIYSVLPDFEVANLYDTQFGYIYDWVACNPIYNRFIWGYSIQIFAMIAHDTLRSSTKGNVLDIGCGSLAFTAKTYIQYSERPDRFADRYLEALAKRGKLVCRNMEDHQIIFNQLGMSITYNINGNLASIYYGD